MSTPPLGDILAKLPDATAAEVVQTLVTSKDVRIERIVSLGQTTPEEIWLEEPLHEWVLVIAGAGRLRFEDSEPIELTAGSYANIPAHTRHRVDWTDPGQPTVWLAVHYR